MGNAGRVSLCRSDVRRLWAPFPGEAHYSKEIFSLFPTCRAHHLHLSYLAWMRGFKHWGCSNLIITALYSVFTELIKGTWAEYLTRDIHRAHAYNNVVWLVLASNILLYFMLPRLPGWPWGLEAAMEDNGRTKESCWCNAVSFGSFITPFSGTGSWRIQSYQVAVKLYNLYFILQPWICRGLI